MMTTEEQIIAVAEWRGLKWEHHNNFPELLPAYDKDLNAIHEVEDALGADNQILYAIRLKEVLGLNQARHWKHVEFDLLHASAPQRLEALCRTLWPERWKE